MNLVIYSLVVLGLTYGITGSSLLSPLRVLVSRWRFFARLVYCPYCVAFWVGYGVWPFVMGADIGMVVAGPAATGVIAVVAALGELWPSPYPVEREIIEQIRGEQ